MSGKTSPRQEGTSETPGRTPDVAPSAPDKHEQKKAEPMTCARACDLLEMAQSPAEIAKVMNEWERVESTQPERKRVIDNKDVAMKRLAAASKKKKVRSLNTVDYAM